MEGENVISINFPRFGLFQNYQPFAVLYIYRYPLLLVFLFALSPVVGHSVYREEVSG